MILVGCGDKFSRILDKIQPSLRFQVLNVVYLLSLSIILVFISTRRYLNDMSLDLFLSGNQYFYVEFLFY